MSMRKSYLFASVKDCFAPRCLTKHKCTAIISESSCSVNYRCMIQRLNRSGDSLSADLRRGFLSGGRGDRWEGAAAKSPVISKWHQTGTVQNPPDPEQFLSYDHGNYKCHHGRQEITCQINHVIVHPLNAANSSLMSFWAF